MSRCQFLSFSLVDVCFFPFTLFPLWSSDWCGLWLNRGSLPELKAELLIVRVASGQEGSFNPGWRLEFWLLVHSLWSSGGNPLPEKWFWCCEWLWWTWSPQPSCDLVFWQWAWPLMGQGTVTEILFVSWSVIHLKRIFALRGETHINLARKDKQVLGKP